MIRRRRINERLSGRKGTRRGSNTTITRELGKDARANKPTERVEVHRIDRVEEREQGVKPKETGGRNQKRGKSIKLSLRGSVEIQAQHWLESTAKLVFSPRLL